MKEARYYNLEGEEIRCLLCPQKCRLKEGQKGRCQIREVKDGKLIAATYKQVGSLALDPIEKKPLYHFYPGTQILSLGTAGCNLQCKFCQNYQLAHDTTIPTREIGPEEVVELAKKKDAVGVAYTYSEPLVWYEYVLETSKLAQKAGLKNVLVTNGMINPEPMQELLSYIDGMNLDVKAFTDDFYREVCGGKLEPIKKTAELVYQDLLLEITTLLVTDLNDSPEEIGRLTNWIASLDSEIPFHITRYFPRYKLNKKQTSKETMLKAKEIAEEKLSYVYLGNIHDIKSRHTYCPQCGEVIIKRGYNIKINLKGGKCPECGRKIKIAY